MARRSRSPVPRREGAMRLKHDVTGSRAVLRGVVAGVAAVLAMSAAHARDIHYGAVADARLAACDAAEWQGKQADARAGA